MALLTDVLVVLIALLHFYFLVLEMFLWDKPKGLSTFGQTLEAARASKTLATCFPAMVECWIVVTGFCLRPRSSST